MTGRGIALKRDVPRRETGISSGLHRAFHLLASGKQDETAHIAGWPLYLWGDTGTGKTCAALWFVDQVPSSAYLTADKLASVAYQPESLAWEMANQWLLLVVDELGMRSPTEDGYAWQREKTAVKRMADLREYLPTIWISNKPPEEIRQLYDDRIHSRICSGTVIHLTGPDRRFE